MEKIITMRTPFLPGQISKLPKPTKAQTDEVKANFKSGIRCGLCDGWHHPKVVHLDYVGHAALTDRLLDVDPGWTWEPLALSDGLPKLDGDGGLWIKLTVLGVTRIGYGHADGKQGGDAMKERIGDALRNAAMRFGAALELWHKGGNFHKDCKKDDPEPISLEELHKLCADKVDERGVVKKGYKSMIQSGDKTAAAFITWLSARVTLSDEIKQVILSWESNKVSE